jgi:hypothetical protein
MLSATIGFIVNRALNFIDPSGNLQYFLLEIFPVVLGPQMGDNAAHIRANTAAIKPPVFTRKKSMYLIVNAQQSI